MKIFGGIFTLVGIAFLALVFFLYQSDAEFKSKAERTTGTITDIVRQHDRDDQDHYTPEVEFTVNGRTYSGTLNYYSSSMFQGQRIDIFYNPNNPNNFRSGEGETIPYIIFGILGGIFALIGGGVLGYGIISSVKRSKVKKYNFTVKAEITDLSIKTTLTVNGKHPFVLEACYANSKDGKTYFFKSENIWRDIRPILKQHNITQVPVYVNPENFKEYAVDIQSITKYIGN